MSLKWWIPLVLVLSACPSPEDGAGEGGAGAGGQGGQNGQPGAPGSGPGGAGGVYDEATGTNCNASMDQKDAEVQYTQEQLSSGDVASVTFSGTITCDSCTAPLLLRVGGPPPEGANPEDGAAVLTSLEVQPNAAYEIKLPTGESPVVFELLAGDNGSWFGVKDDQGGLVPSADKADVDMNVSKCGTVSAEAGTNNPPPSGGGQQEQGNPNIQPDGSTAEGPNNGASGTIPEGEPADLPEK